MAAISLSVWINTNLKGAVIELQEVVDLVAISPAIVLLVVSGQARRLRVRLSAACAIRELSAPSSLPRNLDQQRCTAPLEYLHAFQ
jgi:hypothetical protein